MKTLLNIGALIIFLAAGIGIGLTARRKPVVKLVQIPSQREIQQRLTDLDKPRYNPGKVDGVIGAESRKAWDNYECDQFAIRAVEGE